MVAVMMAVKFFLFWCFLVLALLEISDSQMSEHRVVEVLAVIDQPSYDKWRTRAGVESHEDVVDEVKAFFFEVNVMYQSLRAFNQSIEIRLQDILFPNVTIPGHFIDNNTIWQEVAMNGFKKWLKANVNYSYDHAMYITKFDLKGASKSETGLATVNSVCSKNGVSQVEMKFTYRTISTMAHEIGHGLGASHDSKKDPQCKQAYVMHPGAYMGSRNRFFFSPCTAKKFAKYVFKSGKKKCLLPDKTTAEPIVSLRLGQLVEPNDQCKRYYGKKVSDSYKSGDKACNTLKCSTGKWIKKVNTAEGSKCGNGKRCYGGHCVKVE